MTERELKLYAISGIIARIEAEKKKLAGVRDNTQQDIIKANLYKLVKDYEELKKELEWAYKIIGSFFIISILFPYC